MVLEIRNDKANHVPLSLSERVLVGVRRAGCEQKERERRIPSLQAAVRAGQPLFGNRHGID